MKLLRKLSQNLFNSKSKEEQNITNVEDSATKTLISEAITQDEDDFLFI